MAIKLYTGVEKPIPMDDIYIKVEEKDNGVHLTAVNRDGSWIRHLFTLTKDGIARNYSARGVGFPTDKDGRINVTGD